MNQTNRQCTALHHVALGAAEPGDLAEFYHTLLGLQEVARHYEETPDRRLRSVWLRLGDGVLMIERSEHLGTESIAAHSSGGPPVVAGVFLLTWTIAEDDRVWWRERLEVGGAPVLHETRHTMYTRDPDGNWFALSSYPL